MHSSRNECKRKWLKKSEKKRRAERGQKANREPTEAGEEQRKRRGEKKAIRRRHQFSSTKQQRVAENTKCEFHFSANRFLSTAHQFEEVEEEIQRLRETKCKDNFEDQIEDYGGKNSEMTQNDGAVNEQLKHSGKRGRRTCIPMFGIQCPDCTEDNALVPSS